MFFNLNELVKKELSDISKMIKVIESSYKGSITVSKGVIIKNGGNECLRIRCTEEGDRKSTRLNSSHPTTSRMPSSA